jgi:hypothetical protein
MFRRSGKIDALETFTEIAEKMNWARVSSELRLENPVD